MHICYQEGNYPYKGSGGGAGTYVQLTARELVRRGHRVSVLAARYSGQPAMHEDEGVAVYRVPLPERWHGYAARMLPLAGYALALRVLEWDLAFFWQLRAIHRRHPVDLLENGPIWSAWRAPCTLVAHLHGSSYTVKRLSGRPVTPSDRRQRVIELL